MNLLNRFRAERTTRDTGPQSTGVDDLILRSTGGPLSLEEEERLRTWRSASAANEAHFQEVAAVLHAVSQAAPVRPAPAPPPVHAVIARGSLRETERRVRRRRRQHWAWGANAVAAVAVLLLVLTNPFAKPEFTLGVGEFVTGELETATLVLADGTVVRLAPDSRLRLPGSSGAREVFLDGTAFFAVARMPGLPFHVRTRAGDAHVLGTRFEIKTEADDLRVVVLEGRVAVGSGADRVEVGAGEMSLVSKGTSSAPVRVEDVRPLVRWLDRFIVFQSTPLQEVASELEQEYGVPVELTDEALADLTVTGWYADKSFEEVLAVVCGVVRADCSIRNGTAYIASRGLESDRRTGLRNGVQPNTDEGKP